MIAALLILAIFLFVFWLVFFKLKLLTLSPAWGVVSSLFFIHVLLIFLIGMRFVTPYSTDARVIQHTIQLIPRLPEPTLVTAVLVAPDVPVKQGEPLFLLDRRPYEYQVGQLQAEIEGAQAKVVACQSKVKQQEAELVAANQDVLILGADMEATSAKVSRLKSEMEYTRISGTLPQPRGAKAPVPSRISGPPTRCLQKLTLKKLRPKLIVLVSSTNRRSAV